MGEEDLDDLINDADYCNALMALQVLSNVLYIKEEYEMTEILCGSWKRISTDYIDFRLKKFDSEGRMVIREVYKVLGYNPYNPKQIGGKKNDKR